MVSEHYIQRIVDKLKQDVNKCVIAGKYDDALSLVSVCANILYVTNICYVDNDLEEILRDISKNLNLNNKKTESYKSNEGCLLFYDGLGYNERGLIQIYLKALCKRIKVVYVTYYDRKQSIPDVLKILSEYDCESRFINRKKTTNIDQINQLNDILTEFKPAKMFFYSVPDDVIATPIMYAYENVIMRYQINMTDHAFWLGAGCIDKCIEFRNYGAALSNEYRNISKNKMVIIPFYPILHREKEFCGFPFEKKEGCKVLFSGGSIYKTLGDNNKYYKIVDNILKNYNNVIFWYAGSGNDREIKKIISKYPGRAFLTAERTDLLQVLENCDIYLSTYPLNGGLMFQYAAAAGCVPVTLKSWDESDGFLINQMELGVEFENEEELYVEIGKLLSDTEYADARSALMKKSVPTSDIFDLEIENLILENDKSAFPVIINHIDTREHRQWCLECLSKSDVNALFVRRNAVKQGVRYYPLRFLAGGLHIVANFHRYIWKMP